MYLDFYVMKYFTLFSVNLIISCEQKFNWYYMITALSSTSRTILNVFILNELKLDDAGRVKIIYQMLKTTITIITNK